jgi:uncharacterized membrane protein
MSLAPLLNAAPAIQIHAFAAMGVLTVALTSFWIHEIRLLGPWSPIHLLSILTLFTVPLAVWAAHRHHVSTHRKAMISIFLGALLIAGLFTFVPGRIMYQVVIGG